MAKGKPNHTPAVGELASTTNARNIVKELGKISSCYIGRGGYQDAMIGLNLGFSGKGWGVGTFIGGWDTSITVDKHTQWTEEDRAKQFADVIYKVDELLRQANKYKVEDLVGVPVEISFESGTLKSWRILEEVL